MYFENKPIESGLLNVQSFATHFKSVYTTPSTVTNTSDSNTAFHLSDLNIDISEIFTSIGYLDINKNPGEDAIPPILVKNCQYIISQPLWILFNKSLFFGSFPTKWKTSLITSIHKSGDKNQIENYRPISALNTFAKIFEEIITSKLMTTINILPAAHLSKRRYGTAGEIHASTTARQR
ncbi:RNA-directed DNA polymerase from mobile element jockey [Dufourea novaeangliae]|uniref:RNA-directed DNA polymerase from mobile element jockey n=1 Tax=Dufourea novaeangliae TaxID=178035 RepID=A0A154P7H3_DUFNO|nr:RNA-directed DNA polymerase from mobile element jockey [Dufourea novaeangliae]